MCLFRQKRKTLRLTSGGLKRKSIIAIKERDLLGGDEYGIITMMYKLSDQLGKGYVREPHYCDVELDFTNSDYIDQNKSWMKREQRLPRYGEIWVMIYGH